MSDLPNYEKTIERLGGWLYSLGGDEQDIAEDALALLEHGRWRRVEDELPPNNSTVMAFLDVEGGPYWWSTTVCQFRDGWFRFGGNFKVTHWMPLPTPPTEVEG